MVAPKPPVKLTGDFGFYVTPKIAAEWLTHNTHNRRLSDRLVTVYGDAMKDGEWRLNGEPIIFDYNGVLQSGQHRLAACVESDTPFWTVVIWGAEPESLYSLDSGRRRSFADVLHLLGEKDYGNLATAIVYTWRWQVGAMDRPSEAATHTHYLKVLAETPEIRDYLVHGRAANRVLGKGFSIGMMSAVYWGLSQIDVDDADAFFNQIFSDGEGLTNDDPAFTLLKWARRAAVEDKNPTVVTCAALVVKCWNAFREHRAVRNLSFKGHEAFPEAV